MKDFHLRDPELNGKLEMILNAYYDRLSVLETEMVRLVFIRFKRYSNNEYYLYILTVYALVFFKMVSLENEILTDRDREALTLLTDTFRYEMVGEKEKYVKAMLSLSDELFLVKLIIKYTVLLAEEEYGGFVPHKSEYYRSLGWLIPVLSYKNYEIITSFLQDVYFQKLYPEQYEWTSKAHKMPTKTVGFMGHFMVDITNDMSALMERLCIFWLIKLRKKSFFSIYNKIISKHSTKIYDFVGMRIIFQNQDDLLRFAEEIEKHYIVKVKKDYIARPKQNGYQGIHYTFLYTYRNFETEIELQVRTATMNNIIKHQDYLTHFTYSCEHNKWNPLFTEVHEWVELVREYTMQWLVNLEKSI